MFNNHLDTKQCLMMFGHETVEFPFGRGFSKGKIACSLTSSHILCASLNVCHISLGSQDAVVDDFFRHCKKFDGSPATDIEMVKLLKVSCVYTVQLRRNDKRQRQNVSSLRKKKDNINKGNKCLFEGGTGREECI